MTVTKAEIELREQEVFINEVSDEVLETAACCSGSENIKSFTVSMCTGLQECPF